MKNNKWVYMIALSFIWGSAFILIKKGLIGLDSITLGALRILFAAFFLLTIAYKKLKDIPKESWKHLTYTAFLGIFLPSFLFAMAIRDMNSSIAAILNSLTPLNTLIISVIVFSSTFYRRQIFGILLGLIGTIALISLSGNIEGSNNYLPAIYVLISTVAYAININIIKEKLSKIDSMGICVANFVILIIPATIVLYFNGSFSSVELDGKTLTAIGYVFVLGILGTAIALILFNRLIKLSDSVFASSVTYFIPVIALLWGLSDGEKFGLLQVLSSGLIIIGVYIVNKKKKPLKIIV